ncbi:MAG TPA: sodium:proton antiporter [Herpetosiphonaceae bacterium]
MTGIYWYIIIGLLLLGVTALGTLLKRLPVSTSIIYLAVGAAVGPYGLKLLAWDLIGAAPLLERLTEIAVLVSLFTVGLQLRRSLTDRAWWLPVRLASLTMLLSIALVALLGVAALGLPLGAAILLGAILAPTDPVLASDVQVRDAQDRDTLRYSLSGEAGLNDGTAFPFVMLGLGLLGLHPQEHAGLAGLWAPGSFSLASWLGWDVAWAVAAGLLAGGAVGWFVGWQILRRRQFQEMALSIQAFLVFGVIALAYGLAELAYGYGFLAVFAAGYALRYLELRASDHAEAPPSLGAVAPDDDAATQLDAVDTPGETAHFIALSLNQFSSQMEHILEAAVVVLLGAMLSPRLLTWDALWLAPALFLAIRPLAVALGLWGSATGRVQRLLTGWFGIRGIGSLYYLSYAIAHKLPDALAQRLAELTVSLIAVSIVAHGVSVTPLMSWYERRVERRDQRAPSRPAERANP